jgi:hypothetical protein
MQHKEQQLKKAHCIKECRKWQTLLNELRIQNIGLKEQLSQAISHDVSLEFVEQAELYHQMFLDKDQLIDLLRHDINIILSAMPQPGIADNEGLQYIILRKDIEKLISDFHQMEISFSRFVVSYKNK